MIGPGGCLHRQVADIHQVAVHFPRHLRLFLSGAGDHKVALVDRGDGPGDQLQSPAGRLRHLQGAVGAALAAVHCTDCALGADLDGADHLLDLRRGLLRAVGQCAHFVGDHGEATACLASSGGLDGGIERQQVGLAGNRADHIQHAGNFVGAVGQPFDLCGGTGDVVDQVLNRSECLVNLVLTITGGLVRVLRGFGGAHGVAGHFLDGTGHLVDRGGGLVDLGALQQQVTAGVLGDAVQLLRGRGQAVGGGGDLANGLAQALLHAAQSVQQQRGFVLAGHYDLASQVANGNTLGHHDGLRQRRDDTVGEQQGDGDQHQDDQQQRNDDCPQGIVPDIAAVLRGGVRTFVVEINQCRQRVHHMVRPLDQRAADLLLGLRHAAFIDVREYLELQVGVLLARLEKGIEQVAILRSIDGRLVAVQAVAQRIFNAAKQVQARSLAAAVLKGSTQCGRTLLGKAGANAVERNHGR